MEKLTFFRRTFRLWRSIDAIRCDSSPWCVIFNQFRFFGYRLCLFRYLFNIFCKNVKRCAERKISIDPTIEIQNELANTGKAQSQICESQRAFFSAFCLVLSLFFSSVKISEWKISEKQKHKNELQIVTEKETKSDHSKEEKKKTELNLGWFVSTLPKHSDSDMLVECELSVDSEPSESEQLSSSDKVSVISK